MTITELRTAAGMSRAELSRFTGIPIRTLENWEAGVRTPPAWAVELLAFRLRHIDIE